MAILDNVKLNEVLEGEITKVEVEQRFDKSGVE